jgi:hypothetical protein
MGVNVLKLVAIDGVLKNQLDKYATGCNTSRSYFSLTETFLLHLVLSSEYEYLVKFSLSLSLSLS